MSIGMILLVVVAVLALFGVLQRVLDRMRLKDWQALVVVAAIFVGGWIPDIHITPSIAFNIGGGLIPLALCVYLFVRAGTAKERWRSIGASVGGAVAVYLLGRFLPAEAENTWIDPMYLYGIAAGIIAYVLGRSRRSAFIAGVMGIILADIAQAVINAVRGVPYTINIGGGGMFDGIVISAVLAVAFAEIFGELRERMQGGPKTDQGFEKDGEIHREEERE